MFRKNLRAMSCALLTIACGEVVARGEIVTYEFTGSVGFIIDSDGVLPDGLTFGVPASASLRFDTATPDLFPDDPGRGTYLSPGWLMFDVGGLKFERTTWVQVDVWHGGEDLEMFNAFAQWEMTAWPFPQEIGDHLLIQIGYLQRGSSFTMLESDAAPSVIHFEEATDAVFEVTHISPGLNRLFTLRMTMTPVPEPTTWALLGLGLAALGWRARRS